MKHYLLTVGDALSQLLNAAVFLSGNANESLSGRCFRQRDHWLYGRLQVMIDAVAAMLGDYGHCARAHRKDVTRASYTLQGKTLPDDF